MIAFWQVFAGLFFMKNLETLTGIIENIIFHNTDNLYTVFALSTQGEEMTCTGFLSVVAGESVKLTGEYTDHPSYGKQFAVATVDKQLPTSAKAIEKYLASGTIKGVGKALAARIVDEFGQNTLQVIEQTPDKLVSVRGVSKALAKNIHESFASGQDLRRIILALNEWGISTAAATKIYQKYKSHAIDVIKENPYLLVTDIYGISFKTADVIARQMGIDPYSMYRIKAGIRFLMSQGQQQGHTCLEKTQLINTATELLTVEAVPIDNALVEMQLEKYLYQEIIKQAGSEQIYIYLGYLHSAENYVAKKILELAASYPKAGYDDEPLIARKMAQAEQALDIQLATQQKQAVQLAMSQGAMVITGGPGTGKTTIIKTITTLLLAEGYTLELAAPTGRAAKRMSEATGLEAKTIHRALGINFASDSATGQTFDRNEDNPIEADVIIIDETSMVDLLLMYHLLKAIAQGSRLILVGDAHQLPSVGAGNVLKDIIASTQVPVVSLSEIFRQAAQSLIVTNAHRINSGNYPDLSEKSKDFFFLRRENQDHAVETILGLCAKRLVDYGYPTQDIQVLCPMKKGTIGTLNLNKHLQQALNPADWAKPEVAVGDQTFRLGDRVMQIKNNYQTEWTQAADLSTGLGVFNGDEGYITSILEEQRQVTITFYDGKVVHYDYKNLGEITLSYAITIHKSQGSEYKCVIIPAYMGPPMLHNRNLLYTGLTRAKKLAVFVGIEAALYKMVDNDQEIARHSFLAYRIQKIHALFQTETQL